MKTFSNAVACGCVLAGLQSQASAELDVFLDFNSQWAVELNHAASLALQPSFSAAEIDGITLSVIDHVTDAFDGYQINFHTTEPGGSRDRVDFGVFGNGLGPLGTAPINVGNYTTGHVSIPEPTVSVYPSNFAFIIDDETDRPTLIEHLTYAMTHTVVHELGHSLGLNHHHAYGNPGITPANYANTGGLQNQHYMSTITTGTHEIGREGPHVFNRWERALLDITGGMLEGGDSVVNNPIREVNERGDAIDDHVGSIPLAFKPGETSGMNLSFRRGDLDGTEFDLDVYRFHAAGPGLVTVEMFSSISKFGSDGYGFDGFLSLYDSNLNLLAENGDLSHFANAFNDGTFRGLDPILLNIPISEAGIYYIVTEVSGSGAVGDTYQLVTGFDGELGPTPGDFNNNDIVDATDIDLLIEAYNTNTPFGDFYDTNNDQAFSLHDLTFLVQVILGTDFGDTDTDGDVDLSDLSNLAANYGGASRTWGQGDFDADGDVDLNDLSNLAAHYGQGEAQAFADFAALNVPEPAGLALAGLMGLMARRWRCAPNREA